MPENANEFGVYAVSFLIAFGPIAGLLWYAWRYHWKPAREQRRRHQDSLHSIQELIERAKSSKPVPLESPQPYRESKLEDYNYDETRVDPVTGARYRERIRSQRLT